MDHKHSLIKPVAAVLYSVPIAQIVVDAVQCQLIKEKRKVSVT